MAESLRKPALARRIFSADCSSSVCGINGLDSALAVSMIPCMRGSLETDCAVSISTKDAGRLMRVKRSWARLLRWEIIDSTDQIPKTKTPNTMKGIRSLNPTIASNTVTSPTSKNQQPRITTSLHFDVDNLLD